MRSPPLIRILRQHEEQFRRLIKRTKRRYFRDILEGAAGKDIYQFRKWSKASRNYVSSPLNVPGERPAVTPQEKADVFLRTHFPPPAPLADHPPDLQTPAPTDIAWNDISRSECLRALLKTSPDKSPGEDGITTRALQWTWDAGGDEYHILISKCIAAGYHPQRHHRSIATALRKPGKPDYSLPRAWRLIQLLNTLGKWIEKVIANRLLFYGVKHNLIPRSQFGAMPGRSTVDAALCLVHDIKAADNHDLFTSVLTFDITGYFDNVNHERLLTILRQKGIPLPICKWVHSFVSQRWVEIRVDGTQSKAREVQTGCPQGSPVSGVLANYYSAPLLESFSTSAERFKCDQHDEFNDLPDAPPTYRQTFMSADLFVDDGKLHTSSSSITNNTMRLQNAFKKVLLWAEANGVAIDYEKIDFINFARKGKKFGFQPDISLPLATDPNITRDYAPKESIRWLGIILDPRLTFNEHTKHLTKRGLTAANCLGMLANTVGGLTQVHVKTLYTACVLPAITYAAPVWWTNKKGHLKALTKVQNQCLRKVLPVFRTTPITAMETESGIPPLNLRLDHICARTSARLAAKIDDSNPTFFRLPEQFQNRPAIHAPIDIPLPIIPIIRLRNHPPNPSKSPIHTLISTVPPDIELIYPEHILDPWRPDMQDNSYQQRFKLSPAIPGISKEEAAEVHQNRLLALANNPNTLIVYTDGSQMHNRGGTIAGAGWVLYHLGIERDCGREGLGSTAEVYDAEMLALPRGFQCAIQYIDSLDHHDRAHKHIVLFSDNTSAVRSISSNSPTSSQSESRRFMELVTAFLDGNPTTSVEVAWVPGHRNIAGNERADEEAKAACALDSPIPKTTIAHYYRNLKADLVDQWKTLWANSPRTGRYAIANRLPPSLKGNYAFRKLTRANLGLITQVRTGHGHYGEYYRDFNIPEPQECPCGAILQSRSHILFDCPLHDEHRYLLHGPLPDGHLTTLLGTKDGIDSLAAFLKATTAFRKRPLEPPPNNETPPNNPVPLPLPRSQE